MRIAIVNDYELVVVGIAAMLAPHHEQVAVVEVDSGLPVISDVDVILYDTFGQVQGDGVDLEDLVHGSAARVVIFSWNLQSDLVERAIKKGASGYLSKGMRAQEIITALLDVHAGKIVMPAQAEADRAAEDDLSAAYGDWPGRDYGLTNREAEVLALITQGLSNQEIALRTYLSINSVKTYIRNGYRKIGATRRSHAVIWGMKHGFEPDRARLIEPAALD